MFSFSFFSFLFLSFVHTDFKVATKFLSSTLITCSCRVLDICVNGFHLKHSPLQSLRSFCKGTMHSHIPNAWAPGRFLCQSRKSKCWLLCTNLCSIWAMLMWETSFPSFPAAASLRQDITPPAALAAAGGRQYRAPPSEVRCSWPRACSWPGGFHRKHMARLPPGIPLAALSPGTRPPRLWTTGCYPPSRILPGKLVPLAAEDCETRFLV